MLTATQYPVRALPCLLLLICSQVFALPKSNVSYQEVLSLNSPEPDLRLSYGSDQHQTAELWLPPGQAAAPIVVFIHGGCWLDAYDIKHTHPFSNALRRQGYAVYSIEYRRLGHQGGGWPGTFDDVIAGINHLAQFEHPQLDKGNVVLTGHSAGGHLALLAAQQTDAIASNLQITGIIGLAAVADLPAYAQGDSGCQQAAKQLVASHPHAETQANPNPTLLTLPALLLQGSADTIVPETQRLPSPHTARLIDGAGHFDFIHPESLAFAQLVDSLGKHTQ